jgi:hypothetical protein
MPEGNTWGDGDIHTAVLPALPKKSEDTRPLPEIPEWRNTPDETINGPEIALYTFFILLVLIVISTMLYLMR